MIRFGPATVNAMLTRNLSRLRQNLFEAQNQAMTGAKIERPSDDPARRAEIDRLAASRQQQHTWVDNSEHSLLNLKTADTALGRASEVVKRAQEIAVQMSNEIHSPTARGTAAIEVSEMHRQLADIANTEVAGRHLFSGEAYDQAAFDLSGTYQGSTDEPEVLIGPNQTVKTGFDGSRIFQGTTDVFATLEDLSTALEANDPTATQAVLDDLRAGLNALLDGRAEIGFAMNRVDDASQTATNLEQTMDQGLGEIIGVDPVEAYTKLSELQTGYEAALQISARNLGSSLFNFV